MNTTKRMLILVGVLVCFGGAALAVLLRTRDGERIRNPVPESTQSPSVDERAVAVEKNRAFLARLPAGRSMDTMRIYTNQLDAMVGVAVEDRSWNQDVACPGRPPPYWGKDEFEERRTADLQARFDQECRDAARREFARPVETVIVLNLELGDYDFDEKSFPLRSALELVDGLLVFGNLVASDGTSEWFTTWTHTRTEQFAAASITSRRTLIAVRLLVTEADAPEAKKLLSRAELALQVLVMPGTLGETPIAKGFGNSPGTARMGLNARAVGFRVVADGEPIVPWTALGPPGALDPTRWLAIAELRGVLGSSSSKPGRLGN